MKRLDQKVVLVTGAGMSDTPDAGVGVGHAISTVFAREGATVVAIDTDPQAAQLTCESIANEGFASYSIVADVADPAACEHAVNFAVDRFGRIDTLVNSAAVVAVGSAVEADLDDWRRVIDVNLSGAMLMSRFAIPVMIAGGGGSIVNIASIAGHRSSGMAAYVASKAGLEALTVDTAGSYGISNVRANAVLPGSLHAPMTARLGLGDDAVRRMREASAPLGTTGTGWDVAFAVLFLASDEARWITGVSLPVDGGVMTSLPMNMFARMAAAGGFSNDGVSP